MLVSEAARMAQSLGFGRAIPHDKRAEISNRVFWVIYAMEKTTCFYAGRRSVRPLYILDRIIAHHSPGPVGLRYRGACNPIRLPRLWRIRLAPNTRQVRSISL